MNIFYFSAEVEPFAKSGGLGDVMGALPKAVAKQHNTFVVMPYYVDIIKPQYKCDMKYCGYFYTDLGWRHQYVGVFAMQKDGVNYYFLDNEFYFKGPMYCFADNERFAFFAKASLDLVCWLNVKADVLHCNDWSTGFIPVLHHAYYQSTPQLADAKIVYTIHNLRYQGWTSVGEVKDLTGLSDWYFTQDRLLHGDSVNIMKGAMVFSNAITTVSQTYAEEITTSRYGEGLEGVTGQYRHKTRGILNGVDYTTYNPKTDKLVVANFDGRNLKKGKLQNKLALQKELGLPQRQDVAMIGLISRFVDQKGLDMVGEILQQTLQKDVQLVALGTGERCYEDMFVAAQQMHPDKVSANIFFDNALAHRIYASSDFVLVPSVFEPCGLTQLIGLKYGAVPIVRETGGLKDTISNYNPETGEGNGFTFVECWAGQLAEAIDRALDCYYNHREQFENIRKFGIKQDFSWKESSAKYIALYKQLVG
ncbi:MAG: glycogen synthase [Clostridia bacterium]|nr:glycogen synthase [Clostridia bacterium]MBR2966676.1 glycogen synthase [Clostridia bacterium]